MFSIPIMDLALSLICFLLLCLCLSEKVLKSLNYFQLFSDGNYYCNLFVISFQL